MTIYKYTLDKDEVFEFTLGNEYDVEEELLISINFYNKETYKIRAMGSIQLTPTLSIEDPAKLIVTIYSGYSWDGCTPKFKLGTNIIGAWDGFTHIDTKLPKAYYGSLIHDFLLQFKEQLPNTISYNLIHLIMLNIFKKYHFQLAYPYFILVHTWFAFKKLFGI